MQFSSWSYTRVSIRTQNSHFSTDLGEILNFQTKNLEKFVCLILFVILVSHWTKVATDGKYMVTDVQGWKVDIGQYIVTDPIVFSDEVNKLGLVDYGEEGAQEWTDLHMENGCNDVCKHFEEEK